MTERSFIYRDLRIYRAAMSLLYGGQYKDRFRKITDLIPKQATSVFELCFEVDTISAVAELDFAFAGIMVFDLYGPSVDGLGGDHRHVEPVDTDRHGADVEHFVGCGGRGRVGRRHGRRRHGGRSGCRGCGFGGLERRDLEVVVGSGFPGAVAVVIRHRGGSDRRRGDGRRENQLAARRGGRPAETSQTVDRGRGGRQRDRPSPEDCGARRQRIGLCRYSGRADPRRCERGRTQRSWFAAAALQIGRAHV